MVQCPVERRVRLCSRQDPSYGSQNRRIELAANKLLYARVSRPPLATSRGEQRFPDDRVHPPIAVYHLGDTEVDRD